MTVPNIFNSTARVATWDGAGIYDALRAEINANGAGNGIQIVDETATGMLLAFDAIQAAFDPDVFFSVRVGSTSNFISCGIAADGTVGGAGAAGTPVVGTGADWSGEREHDWTIGAPGAGSKMWVVMLDDAIFVFVTDTANTFQTSILHIGRIYVPTTSAGDFAAGRDGLGWLMGVPDAMTNGTSSDWIQSADSSPSAVHVATGEWGGATAPTQISYTMILEPSQTSHPVPTPCICAGYFSATQQPLGVFKYIGCDFALENPNFVRPNPNTNQGWLHFNDQNFNDGYVLIWDKTVTP